MNAWATIGCVALCCFVGASVGSAVSGDPRCNGGLFSGFASSAVQMPVEFIFPTPLFPEEGPFLFSFSD